LAAARSNQESIDGEKGGAFTNAFFGSINLLREKNYLQARFVDVLTFAQRQCKKCEATQEDDIKTRVLKIKSRKKIDYLQEFVIFGSEGAIYLPVFK